MDILLRDKVAVITGASKGIGRAIAIELAKAQASIALLGRNIEKLSQVQKECMQYTSRVEIFQLDLNNAHEIYDAILKVTTQFPKINLLICNAGVLETRNKKFWEIETEMWQKTFKVNLFANIDLIQACLPYLRKEEYSKIILISSNIGIRPPGFASDYCASKAALINLGQSLAIELAPFKILVNTICPGPVKTDMLNISPIMEENIKNYIPLKKLGQPQDVANLVTFLCSDNANWITGGVFVIDGGALLPYAKN